MFKGVLTRIEEDSKQTLGCFSLYDNTDLVFSAKSLELPWLGNEQCISCIPAGDYICKRRQSVKHGHHFAVHNIFGGNVRDREFILIHKGNFNRDIQGCILFGRDHLDIDSDGYRDVTSSKATMNLLNRIVDNFTFDFKVIDMTRSFVS